MRSADKKGAAAPLSGDRRAMIAKVHVAKKALAMSEDSYRALLRRVSGGDSLSACTDATLIAVLAEFKRLGFTAPRRASDKPHVRKIYALWRALKPHLDAPSDDALRSFVKRQTGVMAPEWLDAAQANKVTEGLKAWAKRLGVEHG